MKNLIIRSAKESDKAYITKILRAQFLYHKRFDKQYKVLTIKEYAKHLVINDLTFIAEISKKPVGLVRGTLINNSLDRVKPYAVITDLHVGAKFRNLKIGTELLSSFSVKAKSMGANYLETTVDSQNMSAQRFWKKNDFETWQYKMRSNIGK